MRTLDAGSHARPPITRDAANECDRFAFRFPFTSMKQGFRCQESAVAQAGD
jgi:hypothetical protein